jgi:serine phosphatase RsbU (regulator of sigma subunit)
MEIKISVSKIDQYNSEGSGDTIEVIERPNGGFSLALASGFQNSRASKMVSYSVVKKVISFIADGVRDGAAARAASDALFTQYNGQSLAALTIISVDLQTDTLVFSCNSPAPLYLYHNEVVEKMTTECSLIGSGLDVRPSITEISIEPGLTIIAPSAGMMTAGRENNQNMDLPSSISSLMEIEHPSPSWISDSLLNQAIRLELDQPQVDLSVVVLQISHTHKDNIRRLSVNIPFSISQ